MTTSSSPIATARRCACATSARRSTARRTREGGLGDGKRGGPARRLQAARRQRHRDRRPDQGELPRLHAAMPPALNVDILSDRTQTIRASVEDVSSRSPHHRARRRGDLRVPAQPVGDRHPERDRAAVAARRCALMYLLGYSLDNLSLMALTISVGFVVDDAIVMLENIVRHIEDGMTPLEAALEGRARDRLHHPLDQHLAGRGVHSAAADGRHHRPAVPRVRRHRHRWHRRLGLRRADADADDVRALPAPRTRGRHGRFYQCAERGFRRCSTPTSARLDVVLRHHFLTLVRVPRHRGPAPSTSSSIIPKGFFPQQDTGLITGMSEAAQDVSFAEMAQDELGELGQQGRRRRPTPWRVVGSAGEHGTADRQQRPLLHHAEAAATSASHGGRQSSPGCGRSSRRSRAQPLLCRPRRTSTSAAGSAAPNSSTRCRTPTSTSSTQWAPKMLEKLKTLPELPTSRPTSRTARRSSLSPSTATRPRASASRRKLIDDTLYDAFGQRQVAQYFTQQNSYHVVMEVLPACRANVANARQHLPQVAGPDSRCRSRPSSPPTTRNVGPLSISHQGQFPAVTISFNLAPGRVARQATEAIQKADGEMASRPR